MNKNLLVAVLSVPLATTLAFGEEMPAEGGEAAPMEEMGTDKKMSLGADGAVVLPLGTFGDGAGLGIGALLKFGYSINEAIMATVRAGYIHHLPKDVGGVDLKFAQIPIMLGAKYMFGSAYGAAEFGFVNGKAKAEIQGTEVSTSSTELAFGVGGGYMVGDLDLRVSFNMIDLGHAGDTQELMLNVGYDFAHF
jgi:hypothetical protein